MEEFLTSIKNSYRNWFVSHGQKQYPPRYSNVLVELELVVKEREEYDPTRNCQDTNLYSIKQTHQLVPYSDIFKKEKEQVVRKVHIEGSIGIGKTTFCMSVSENWANGKLFQEFKVLLLLPLDQKKIAATNSLSELIETLQGAANPSAVDYLNETNGKGTLIIADGWDESECPTGTFLHNLLFGHDIVLGHASIIVTSRPSSSDWIYANGCIGKFLRITGFDYENIRQYIQLEFTRKQQNHLLEVTECNPLIKSMCCIPLNCTTLCHLWRTDSQKGVLSTTMTQLCTKMILNVVLHSIKKIGRYSSISHLSSIESLPEELKSSWWDLCRLAFQTIQKSPVSLPKLNSDIVTIGLVDIVNHGKFKSLHFLHPVFQEYLAALHVANQCPTDTQEEQLKLIRSLDIKKFDKQFTMFWRFFFGICGHSTNNLIFLERVILSFSKFDHLRSLICHCAFEARNSAIDKAAIKALSTPSGSKHLGDPHTTHDCDSILYLINKMESLEAGLELNLRACNFKEQQLHTLRKELMSEKNKLKVKNLDLSDNNLPNEKIADLFRKALTAFQSLQKLSLRNNNIGGKKGATATMTALASLKCLIQLDLSFNRLAISALKVLHANVKHNCLACLEILLLQASLTLDAEVNVRYLTTFTQSLLHHCRKLHELDISGNDLGEPGSPVISALICTLTGLKLHVNKEYESEVDENFIKTMEDLVRRQETIGHTVVHGVIVGPGRSGKNSLMDRLMGKGPPDPGMISSSTGVLDNVVKVEVKKLCTMAAAATNLKWRRLEYDEEALELMMITVMTHIASFATIGVELEPVPECIVQLDEHDSVPSAVILVNNESESESDSENEEIAVPKVAKGAVIYADYETEVSSPGAYSREFNLREGPMDIFKRAVELRQRMHALREHLESSWSLYLTNTGGQLEFQELLPLLVCGPSVFFITIPLNKNLHEHYTVQYQYTDGSEKTYPSSSTLMDEILQTLATIAALDCAGPQSRVTLKPKIFFVGTHKDLLPESSADDIIQRIDRQLQENVKQTSLFDQDSIEYAIGTDRLMFTVNNLDKDDDDFQMIRSALQKMVERRKEFTIQCPCSWLVFSLVLRAKHKSSQVLSYNNCFTVAQSCGITSRTELNNALLFIHHRLGLVRYFCVKELNDLVIIDPQILFDTITKLIVETFTSDHANVKEIEEFQQRGIFSMEVMKTISSKYYSDSQLPFKWALKLLNHLGIAAFFTDHKGKQKCFFPSVLCHAPERKVSNISTCSIKPPPPILIAFKSGFCPRAIPGTLITYLMNNELKSSISWKLHQRRVFRNQVSFSVGPADIILKILPTHIQVCFDPQSRTTSMSEVNITCEEAYKQIKRVMHVIIKKFRDCDYYFAFNCTLPECKEHPHPAKIDRGTSKLECKVTDRKGDLPDGYKYWTQISACPQQGNLIVFVKTPHMGFLIIAIQLRTKIETDSFMHGDGQFVYGCTRGSKFAIDNRFAIGALSTYDASRSMIPPQHCIYI